MLDTEVQTTVVSTKAILKPGLLLEVQNQRVNLDQGPERRAVHTPKKVFSD